MSAEFGQCLVEVEEVTEKGNDVAGRLSINVDEVKALSFNNNPRTSASEADGAIFSETCAAFKCTR